MNTDLPWREDVWNFIQEFWPIFALLLFFIVAGLVQDWADTQFNKKKDEDA